MRERGKEQGRMSENHPKRRDFYGKGGRMEGRREGRGYLGKTNVNQSGNQSEQPRATTNNVSSHDVYVFPPNQRSRVGVRARCKQASK